MLRALTVWQPWAHAIACGAKCVENRTWQPTELQPGDYLAIHAGSHVVTLEDVHELRAIAALSFVPVEPCRVGDLPLSAIVAVVIYRGCVTKRDDPWFTGPIGWELSDAVAIDPVSCKGARGLWTVPDAIAEQVRANWKRAKGTK